MREKPLHEKIGDLTSVVMALTYIGGGVFWSSPPCLLGCYLLAVWQGMLSLAHLFCTELKEVTGFGEEEIKRNYEILVSRNDARHISSVSELARLRWF